MTEVNGIGNSGEFSQNGAASIAQTRSRDSERFGFPLASSALVQFGFKFTAGGAHISRKSCEARHFVRVRRYEHAAAPADCCPQHRIQDSISVMPRE